MATLKSTTVDSAGGTDAAITEEGVDRNSASNLTFNVQNSGAGTMALQQDGTGVMLVGKHTCPIIAASLKPSTTSGASVPAWFETTTNDVMIPYVEFADAVTSYAHFSIPANKSWDELTMTYRIFWYSPVATTGNVVWAMQALALSDSDLLDATWGTEITLTDGVVTGTGRQFISAESGALTAGGTPAEQDVLYFRVYRKGGDASDTMAGAARLTQLHVYMTQDKGNDA